MKKTKICAACSILLLSSLIFQSCIGSFSLTNKVLTWNNQVSNKFVNEVIFFAFWILPVYEVTAAADLLVINTIEFWSGNKPLESNNRVIDTHQGNYYILADETGYKITSPNGDIMSFDFDIQNQTWSFSRNNSPKIEFLQFEDDTHIKVLNSSGNFVDVELSRNGVDKFKAEIGDFMMASL